MIMMSKGSQKIQEMISLGKSEEYTYMGDY